MPRESPKSRSILTAVRASAITRFAVSVAATVLGGLAAALANFVTAPIAAVFGLAAGTATFAGTQLWDRRLRAREFDRAWATLTTSGPPGEAWPDDHSVLVALNPEQEVVPYNLVHSKLVSAVAHWCTATDEGMVLCIQGRAGAGKTRLAIELTARIKSEQRLVGWPRSGVAAEAIACAVTAPQPAVLILDDANTRTDLLPALIALAQQDPYRRPKVLLLARDFGQWWRRFRADTHHELAQHLPSVAAIEVGPLTSTSREVQQTFQRALRAYADWSGSVPPTVQVDDDTQPSPALVHAAAFASVEQRLTGRTSVQTAIREIFNIEEDRWRKRAAAAGLAHLGVPVLRSSVIAAALFGAVDAQDAGRLLRRIPLLAGANDALIDELTLWVRNLYPQEAGGRWLSPHLPARLVEGYVVDTLEGHPGLSRALISGAGRNDAASALSFLTAASKHSPAAARIMIDVIDRDPGRLLLTAIEQAEIGSIDAELAEYVTQCELDDEQVSALNALIPASAPKCPLTAIAICRRHAETATEEGERIARLRNLGHWLWAGGLHEEALNTSEQICAYLRAAAKGDPDRHLEPLAQSLHKYAVQLHMAEHRSAGVTVAREAATAYKTLVGLDNDRHLASYILFLDDFATFLAAENLYGEAVGVSHTAVEILRLSNDGGETPVQVAALAIALNNFATHLGAVGLLAQSIAAGEESVDLHRQLVRIDPDSYLEELAKSLTNISIRYMRVRDLRSARKSAEEGVSLYRQLSEARGDAYIPALGKALSNLSRVLSDLGRPHEAIKMGKEAIVILRALKARTGEVEVEVALAESLNMFSVRLSSLGHNDDAVHAAREATRIMAKFAESSPAFTRTYAQCVGNLGLWLGYTGQHEAAERASRTCFEVWERLEASYPGSFRANLASSLDNLGLNLSALGKIHEALDLTRRSVEIYRELHNEYPDAFRHDLHLAMNNLKRCEAAMASLTERSKPDATSYAEPTGSTWPVSAEPEP